MNRSESIERVSPEAGIPGGEVALECWGVSDEGTRELSVWFNESRSHLVAANPRRVLALIPELERSGTVRVSIGYGDCPEVIGQPAKMIVGRKLAGDLHPVANPVFDPTDDSLFVTRSGSRGERVPVSLFRVNRDGELDEFSGDITNPTGIAFDSSGQMFVSSRLDGTVYRVTPLREVVVFASNLGIATDLAFNRDGDLFVGDRSGTIYRINGIGEATEWAEREPSVSAFHLAFGPDDNLYVSGPTVSGFDVITRFDQEGTESTFFRGLGRPQGMAFDRDGNLYVAASLVGRRGIVRISPDGSKAELVVAGMNLIGLAFSPEGEMVVATTDSVYSLPLGIHGLLTN